MLLAIKILLVAFGLIGQAQLAPNADSPVASELDTLSYPPDHPEWALARRAMASEGLCHLSSPAPKDSGRADSLAAVVPEAPVNDLSILRLVAEACN